MVPHYKFMHNKSESEFLTPYRTLASCWNKEKFRCYETKIEESENFPLFDVSCAKMPTQGYSCQETILAVILCCNTFLP